MDRQTGLYVFGEVLFDCFPTGEQILGGAPFNVAWHLQALGDAPLFISRIGDDARGKTILQAMIRWGMETGGLQIDRARPTGRVEVSIAENEPSYDIITDSAFDCISAAELPELFSDGILYHGTLALRQPDACEALRAVSSHRALKIFLDVNLRSPWWRREMVLDLLKQAHWAKMNEHELQLLAEDKPDIQTQMAALQTSYELEQLIVTRGEQGSLVRCASGAMHVFPPKKITGFVDTVGAGDAFSAVYIHGLRAGWSIAQTGDRAQEFAARVIGLRGATTTDPSFYQAFIKAASTPGFPPHH